jgi:HD-like signal output (HDOD) protein
MDPAVDLVPARLRRARAIVRRSAGVRPPPSLLRLEEAIRDPDLSMPQLARLVEANPSLAARVLRMANSALYAPSQPVTDLARAVTILGLTVLRQLVLTTIVLARGTGWRSPHQALAVARTMANAVRTAAAARALAQMAAAADPDEAFAAALLHDVGHLELVDEIGDPYAAYLLGGPALLEDLSPELALAGVTHQEVGLAFGWEWGLPHPLTSVMATHHEGSAEVLPALVAIAERLVHGVAHAGLPADPRWEEVASAAEAGLVRLGLSRGAWEAVLPRLRGEWASLLDLFDLVAG